MGISASPKLVLASASPRRVELLECAGLIFKQQPAATDEQFRSGEPLHQAVTRIAVEKAEHIAKSNPDLFVLGADTVVAISEEQSGTFTVLGKPQDDEDAVRMLSLLQGRSHLVVTAFAIIKQNAKVSVTQTVESEVVFRAMKEEEILAYVATREPHDKAGAYAIQGSAAAFIESVRGSYTNVVGLPLCEVLAELGKLGVWNASMMRR